MSNLLQSYIFSQKKDVLIRKSSYLCTCKAACPHPTWGFSAKLGLTGFDGKTKWYVSTRSWTMGGSLISSVGKLIGNNEYALAA